MSIGSLFYRWDCRYPIQIITHTHAHAYSHSHLLHTHTHTHLEKFALSSKYHLQPRGNVRCARFNSADKSWFVSHWIESTQRPTSCTTWLLNVPQIREDLSCPFEWHEWGPYRVLLTASEECLCQQQQRQRKKKKSEFCNQWSYFEEVLHVKEHALKKSTSTHKKNKKTFCSSTHVR